VDEQLAALASRLGERRELILRKWRDAAENDPELTTASALSRTQFYDHIPEVLDAFERVLSARRRAERREAAAERKEGAAGHGLHRWQQGYQQREVMREWRHLHLCLVEELESYAAEESAFDFAVMSKARRALAELCSEGVCESATQYALFQQAEAAGRVRDLEQALEDIGSLERQRAEAWREAAHDLRGNLGAVKSATDLLHAAEAEPIRGTALTLLQRGVTSLHALLNDLTSLARLEAGHEQRKVAPFDAAAMLRDLCENMQVLATERGLALEAEGPPTLTVEGDEVKTRRIAQNLVQNAIKFTERGSVRVIWAEGSSEDSAERWTLCVQDTGPGLRAERVAPLARALKQATKEAQAVEESAVESGGEASTESEPAPTLASQSPLGRVHAAAGEGIGLSIVKRLCELLDASLELESSAGTGSTFRVIFPRHYGSDGHNAPTPAGEDVDRGGNQER
jgi:signal transduction histidine kinase